MLDVIFNIIFWIFVGLYSLAVIGMIARLISSWKNGGETDRFTNSDFDA